MVPGGDDTGNHGFVLIIIKSIYVYQVKKGIRFLSVLSLPANPIKQNLIHVLFSGQMQHLVIAPPVRHAVSYDEASGLDWYSP